MPVLADRVKVGQTVTDTNILLTAGYPALTVIQTRHCQLEKQHDASKKPQLPKRSP